MGFRLMTITGYGGDDRGSCPVTFRTFDPDVEDARTRDRGGYEVRVVQVEDRLQARQRGIKPLPWVPLPGTTAPNLEVKLTPDRYYAQAQRVENGELLRGPEMKFWLRHDVALTVDLPIPKPGAVLPEPE